MNFKYRNRWFLISLRPEPEQRDAATIEVTLLHEDGTETDFGVCAWVEFGIITRAMCCRLADCTQALAEHAPAWDGTEVAIPLDGAPEGAGPPANAPQARSRRDSEGRE